MLNISDSVKYEAEGAMRDVRPFFDSVTETAEINTRRVLEAFSHARISDSMFGGTTGYGYDDNGRDAIEQVYAELMGAEAALVRSGIVNGSHAIACAIFSALRKGDTLLAATGGVYDTLETLVSSDEPGSLRSYGIGYRKTPLKDGMPDLDAIRRDAADKNVKAVLVQRSKGYSDRKTLSCDDIGVIVQTVKSVNPDAAVIVDNCYGEFVDTSEPCAAGADLCAGSLIKNPGGGLALAGGYVAGKRRLVDAAAARLTLPGIGGECGATLGQNRSILQGLFVAPHVVAEAVKTAVFAAALMERLGFETSPSSSEKRYDIIQTVRFGAPEPLLAFCRGIQAASPIDSFVTPEPWDMPGYDCAVIMAAGAFVQGSSIELSCDAPMRPPYTAYIQGGLTFEAGKLAVMNAASAVLEAR